MIVIMMMTMIMIIPWRQETSSRRRQGDEGGDEGGDESRGCRGGGGGPDPPGRDLARPDTFPGRLSEPARGCSDEPGPATRGPARLETLSLLRQRRGRGGGGSTYK